MRGSIKDPKGTRDFVSNYPDLQVNQTKQLELLTIHCLGTTLQVKLYHLDSAMFELEPVPTLLLSSDILQRCRYCVPLRSQLELWSRCNIVKF